MVAARRIVVIGMRNAYPAALHLRQQLLQARGQVLVLPQPGQSLSEELVDLTADDLVVVMAFRRRPRIVRPLLQQLQRDGVPVLLMRAAGPQSVPALPLAALRAAGQRLGLRQLCLGQQPDQSAGQCLSARNAR